MILLILSGRRIPSVFALILILALTFISSFSYASKKSFGPEYSSLKFGTLSYNDRFKIYRSAKLGKDGLEDLKSYLKRKKMPFPKTIIYMNKGGYKFPFYFALEEHFKSNDYGYDFFHSFGPGRTYVDGYNPYQAKSDIDKEGQLGRKARKHFSYEDDGVDGGVENFKKVLEMVLDEENQPVLFHCWGGRHRTGMIAMAIRYIQGGNWVGKKKYESWGMRLNAAEYEYYKYNKALYRKDNIKFIREFVKEPFFQNLKNQYSSLLVDERNF